MTKLSLYLGIPFPILFSLLIGINDQTNTQSSNCTSPQKSTNSIQNLKQKGKTTPLSPRTWINGLGFLPGIGTPFFEIPPQSIPIPVIFKGLIIFRGEKPCSEEFCRRQEPHSAVPRPTASLSLLRSNLCPSCPVEPFSVTKTSRETLFQRMFIPSSRRMQFKIIIKGDKEEFACFNMQHSIYDI